MAFLFNGRIFFKGKEKESLSGLLRYPQNISESFFLLSAFFLFVKLRKFRLGQAHPQHTNTGLTLYQYKISLLKEI